MLCQKCHILDLKAMKILESLTPSGSEFVNEPERCAQFLRDTRESQHRMIIRLTMERNALRKQLEDSNVKVQTR